MPFYHNALVIRNEWCWVLRTDGRQQEIENFVWKWNKNTYIHISRMRPERPRKIALHFFLFFRGIRFSLIAASLTRVFPRLFNYYYFCRCAFNYRYDRATKKGNWIRSSVNGGARLFERNVILYSRFSTAKNTSFLQSEFRWKATQAKKIQENTRKHKRFTVWEYAVVEKQTVVLNRKIECRGNGQRKVNRCRTRARSDAGVFS